MSTAWLNTASYLSSGMMSYNEEKNKQQEYAQPLVNNKIVNNRINIGDPPEVVDFDEVDKQLLQQQESIDFHLPIEMHDAQKYYFVRGFGLTEQPGTQSSKPLEDSSDPNDDQSQDLMISHDEQCQQEDVSSSSTISDAKVDHDLPDTQVVDSHQDMATDASTDNISTLPNRAFLSPDSQDAPFRKASSSPHNIVLGGDFLAQHRSVVHQNHRGQAIVPSSKISSERTQRFLTPDSQDAPFRYFSPSSQSNIILGGDTISQGSRPVQRRSPFERLADRFKKTLKRKNRLIESSKESTEDSVLSEDEELTSNRPRGGIILREDQQHVSLSSSSIPLGPISASMHARQTTEEKKLRFPFQKTLKTLPMYSLESTSSVERQLYSLAPDQQGGPSKSSSLRLVGGSDRNSSNESQYRHRHVRKFPFGNSNTDKIACHIPSDQQRLMLKPSTDKQVKIPRTSNGLDQINDCQSTSQSATRSDIGQMQVISSNGGQEEESLQSSSIPLKKVVHSEQEESNSLNHSTIVSKVDQSIEESRACPHLISDNEGPPVSKLSTSTFQADSFAGKEHSESRSAFQTKNVNRENKNGIQRLASDQSRLHGVEKRLSDLQSELTCGLRQAPSVSRMNGLNQRQENDVLATNLSEDSGENKYLQQTMEHYQWEHENCHQENLKHCLQGMEERLQDLAEQYSGGTRRSLVLKPDPGGGGIGDDDDGMPRPSSELEGDKQAAEEAIMTNGETEYIRQTMAHLVNCHGELHTSLSSGVTSHRKHGLNFSSTWSRGY